jgi:hypothetical protein
MRFANPATAFSLIVAIALPCFAAGKGLVGQEAPEISTGARTITTMRVEVALRPGKEEKSGPLGYSNNLKEHAGKVVLLLFFDGSEESKKALVRTARLSQRHREKDPPIGPNEMTRTHEWGKDRLVVFGITNDSWGAGDKALMDLMHESHVDFQIEIAPAVWKNYEITKAPQRYLIDRSGKVVLDGRFSADAVDAVVNDPEAEKTESAPPKLELSDKFDAATKALDAGDEAKASAEWAKLDKAAGKDGENARALLKWLDARGTKKVERADAAADAGDSFFARDTYAVVEKWKVACSKDAKAKGSALKSDHDAKKAFAQEKAWHEATAAEQAKDTKKAAELYKKCAKACSGTLFGERCEEHAEALDAAK